MIRQTTGQLGIWAMMAALFALLFSPLPGFACLPPLEAAESVRVSAHALPQATLPQAARCHQTAESTEPKTQKCHAPTSGNQTERCEYSHNAPAEKAPLQTCCCSHGDYSLQYAAMVTAPHVPLEWSEVKAVSFLAPRVTTTRIHFATANSPPSKLLFLQIPARAPPVVRQNKNNLT